MKKNLIISIFTLFLAILAVIYIMPAKGNTRSYYNGDALYYKGVVYLVTTNSGQAELYKIDNNNISLTATIKSIGEGDDCNGFVDGVLNIEQRGLFVFLTDSKYVYKYDINNPSNPILYKRSNDGVKSVILGLGKMDNKVYSVAEQGIKIWNDDMEVVYNATLSNPIPHNIKYSKKGSFIFNVYNDRLEIYDARSQKLLSSIDIQINDSHERNIFNDENNGTIYIADDQAVKQFDFAGNLINSFRHISNQAYDIAYTPGDDHLFFSDGIGIVKLRKDDLKPMSWIYTKSFSGEDGWVTSLKVVRDNYGEKIFVFDGKKIIILNQDFKKVGSIAIGYFGNSCTMSGSLSLTLSAHSAIAGSSVTVNGRGYGPGENVSIYLADKKISSVKADNGGEFTQTIVIPSFKAGAMDFKAVGDSSNKSYSTSFNLEVTIVPVDSVKPVSVNKQCATVGSEITISANGFNPGEYVLIYLDFDKIDIATADSNGMFTRTVKIPSVVKPGVKELRVVGYDSGKNHSINFLVRREFNEIIMDGYGCEINNSTGCMAKSEHIEIRQFGHNFDKNQGFDCAIK